MFFSGKENLLREGNVRAFKFGIYIATAITMLGIYNLIIKMFLDPCCQTHTAGERLLSSSSFLSSIIGGGMVFLIVFIL